MAPRLLMVVPWMFNYLLIVSGNAEVDALSAWKKSLSDPNDVLLSWNTTLPNPCSWFHITCNDDNSVTRMLVHFQVCSICDALFALKKSLSDPNKVLTSWDGTLVNPCTWFHITCNSNNSVTQIELGNFNLSGKLVPQLGSLPNLQFLELNTNNISGKIPCELGNLTNLVRLDLFRNILSGPIPDELGKLSKLHFFVYITTLYQEPYQCLLQASIHFKFWICRSIICQELFQTMAPLSFLTV